MFLAGLLQAAALFRGEGIPGGDGGGVGIVIGDRIGNWPRSGRIVVGSSGIFGSGEKQRRKNRNGQKATTVAA